MKSVKIILYILYSIITALFIFSFFIPGEYNVKRTIEILSPKDTIFQYLNNLNNWEKWTLWNLGNNSNINYEKKFIGVGAKMYWTEKVEKDRSIEITYSVPFEYVKYNMDFGNENFKLSGSFILKEKSNSTSTIINWMTVCNIGFNPLSKYFTYFFFEDYMGNDMKGSLMKLKKKIESNFQ